MSCCAPEPVQFCANRNTMFASNITLRVKGRPFDLNGWTARMQVRERKGQTGTALISVGAVPNPYGSVLTIAGDVLFLAIEQPEMATLPQNADPSEDWVGAYDIVLIDPNGRPQPLFGGDFVVNPGVTR